MTDINRVEAILSTLDNVRLIAAVDPKRLGIGASDQVQFVQDIDDAKSMIRTSVVRENKNDLRRNFRAFDIDMPIGLNYFLEDHTFVCHYRGIAVRRFNGYYYAVKITNPDTFWRGILETESPDDYPLHVMPEEMISSKYPELAMIRVIQSFEMDEEDQR